MTKSRYKIISVILLLVCEVFFSVRTWMGRKKKVQFAGQQNSITSNWSIEIGWKNSWDQRLRRSLETYFDEPFDSSFFWLLPSWKSATSVRRTWHETTSTFNEAIEGCEIHIETLKGRLWNFWKIGSFRSTATLRIGKVAFESSHLLTHYWFRRCRVWLIHCRALMCIFLRQ